MKSIPIPFEQVNRLMVTLDFSDADKSLLAYAAEVCDMFAIEKVFFFHVVKSLDLSDELHEKYPFLLTPVDEAVVHRVKESLNLHFKPKSQVETAVDVVEGQVVEKVLKFAKNKHIDLLLMGRKARAEGSGMAAENIARKVACPTLFVPEKWEFKPLSHILVALDFSKHSHNSLNYALRMAEKTGATVQCVHVYQVPSGYHTSGKNYQEFSEIMRSHAMKEYKLFLKDITIPEGVAEPECTFLALGDLKRPTLIFNAAKSRLADLLITGSRGRSKASAMLIGSVADGLVRLNREIPFLIVKNKHESLDFFDALLKL